jgi:RNA polymerase sigma factor (sigma-70 family)
MSAKSIAEKLLIKPNTTVWSSNTSRLGLVEPLPEGVRQVDAPEQATVALVFADDADSLRDVLTAHQDRLARPDILWVAYPKANRADINRDTLWPMLGEYGLRPITQVSVDEVWSALRFRPYREGEAPFTGGR